MENMYEIKDEDVDKKGFIKFEDILIFIDDLEDIKGKMRLADIELFGRAVKVFIKSEEGTDIEYIQNIFAYEKIECVELFQLEDDKKVVGFGNIKVITNDDGITVLNEYIDFVEDNIEYFINEYEKASFNIHQDINTLSGIEFENICQLLVSRMGFEVEPTKATGDGGIDLIAYNHQPFLEGKYIIQCKRYSGSIGEPILRDLYGVVTSERANKGILITTGYFTQSAISFAEGKPIELIDGDKLNNLIKQYEVDVTTKNFNNHRDIKNVIQAKILLDYEVYESIINELNRNSSNDQLRAKIINYLFECISYADEDEDKYILFNDCKKHIIKYINNTNNSNTKFLKDLYMMLHMQISILEGKFDEAMHMFFDITKLKEFNISWAEISKPKDTIEIWNNGMYRYFYETLFNVIQVCNILDDTIKRDNIISRYKCMLDYQIQRLEYSINTPNETRKQYLNKMIDSISDMNKMYEHQNQNWNKEIEDIRNIDKISKFYILHNYALVSAYEVVYEVGQDFNNGSDKCDISINVETDTLIIDGFNYKIHELPNITKKIQNCKHLLR